MKIELNSGTVTEFLINEPPVNWDKAVQQIAPEALEQSIRELDTLVQSASFLRGYLEGRRGNQKHVVGVKKANALQTSVRKCLGYTHPRAAQVTF